jgi:hypothetical protein
MNYFHALVVPARLVHPVHIRSVEMDGDALMRVAAGGVGLVAGGDWHAYVDSEGMRLVPNFRAEVLIREAGLDLDHIIHGNAMFLGHGPPGEEADAPRHLIRLAEQLFDLPLAA